MQRKCPRSPVVCSWITASIYDDKFLTFDQPNIGQRIGIRQQQIPLSEQESVAASPLKVESDIQVQATTGKPFQSHSDRIGRASTKAEQVTTHSLPGADDDREP